MSWQTRLGGTRFWRIAAFCAALWAVGGGVSLALPAGSGRTLAINLTWSALFVVFLVGTLRRARLAQAERAAWLLMALGGVLAVTLGLAYAVRPFLDAGPDQVARQIGLLLTILYTLCILGAVAMAAFMAGRRHGSPLEAALDALIFAGSALLVLWLLGFREVALDFEHGALSATSVLTPFVGSAVVVGLAVYLRPIVPLVGPLGLIALWGLIGLVSEGVFALLATTGDWYPGHLAEVLGFVRLIPLALAPWARPVWREEGEYSGGPLRDVVIYVPVALALIASVVLGIRGELAFDPVAVGLTLLVGFALLLRQFLVLRALRRLSRSLELRVEERGRELLETRRALEHTQRLDAVGRLAGSVAHDFRNLLTAIVGHADLAAAEPGLPPSARRALEQVVRAVERGNELTGKLLTFARRDVSVAAESMDLDRVVSDSIEFLRRMLPPGIELQLSLGAGASTRGNATQIDRLVSNLLINARDAIGTATGRIEVSTGVVAVGDALAAAHGVSHGRFVVLDVADDGVGMDRETQERIFEPFFTTKPEGEGTGLGLATCYGLVTSMGGFMTVASRPGAGSRFRVFLPAL